MHASYARFHGQNVLVAVFANRFQDELTYAMCTLASGKCIPVGFLMQKLHACSFLLSCTF